MVAYQGMGAGLAVGGSAMRGGVFTEAAEYVIVCLACIDVIHLSREVNSQIS